MAARSLVVIAAALAGAAAPGRAGATDLEQLANLADQVQAAAWSQAAGAESAASATSAQAPSVDVAQTVAQVTHAALAGTHPEAVTQVVHETVADVAPVAVVAEATPRVVVRTVQTVHAVLKPLRARPHEKARPRVAAAAASPLPVARPSVPVEAQAPAERPVPTHDRGEEKKRPSPGAAPEPRSPGLPFHVPPLPFPFAMPSSAGAASGGGPLVPPLLVALAAAFLLFSSEVLIRRVPSRRQARPRRIVLPHWRPG